MASIYSRAHEELEFVDDDELAAELDLLEAIERFNTQSLSTKCRRRLLRVRAEFQRRHGDQ
jgi:predicted house-cleaning noncanonical NTP pyrophosphatase (MazG superfamily)